MCCWQWRYHSCDYCLLGLIYFACGSVRDNKVLEWSASLMIISGKKKCSCLEYRNVLPFALIFRNQWCNRTSSAMVLHFIYVNLVRNKCKGPKATLQTDFLIRDFVKCKLHVCPACTRIKRSTKTVTTWHNKIQRDHLIRRAILVFRRS